MKKSTTKPKVASPAKPRSASKDQSGSKASSATRPKSKPKPRAPSGDGSKRQAADGPTADAEEVLERLEETYKKQCEEAEMTSVAIKPVAISLRLIARRNLPRDVADGPHDKLIESLSKLTHLRLDRESIGQIDDLEMMGPITNLYLQQNQIRKIENLESLQSLRFLTLANNMIERVENLNVLPELKLVDLSSNQIQELRTEELPKSLLILNTEGNPCTQLPDHRKRILLSLPYLRQLDGVKVTRQERLEAGCQVITLSSDEDEEEEDDDSNEELTGDSPSTTDDDVLQMSADLIKKSRLRSQQQAAEHYRHMEQLVEARSQSQMAMNTARSSLGFSPRSPGRTATSTSLDSERLMSGSAASR